MNDRFNRFASEVIATQPVTRLSSVRDYIRLVGMEYFLDRDNLEHSLLTYWERGLLEGNQGVTSEYLLNVLKS